MATFLYCLGAWLTCSYFAGVLYAARYQYVIAEEPRELANHTITSQIFYILLGPISLAFYAWIRLFESPTSKTFKGTDVWWPGNWFKERDAIIVKPAVIVIVLIYVAILSIFLSVPKTPNEGVLMAMMIPTFWLVYVLDLGKDSKESSDRIFPWWIAPTLMTVLFVGALTSIILKYLGI